MKLILKTKINRKQIAKRLSAIVEGDVVDELPYMPNEGDDSYWTLDSGNNYKVKFYDDEPNRLNLTYRYQCDANQHEQALCEWLKVRLRAKTI